VPIIVCGPQDLLSKTCAYAQSKMHRTPLKTADHALTHAPAAFALSRVPLRNAPRDLVV